MCAGGAASRGSCTTCVRLQTGSRRSVTPHWMRGSLQLLEMALVAQRISGVTPATLLLLLQHVRKHGRQAEGTGL